MSGSAETGEIERTLLLLRSNSDTERLRFIPTTV